LELREPGHVLTPPRPQIWLARGRLSSGAGRNFWKSRKPASFLVFSRAPVREQDGTEREGNATTWGISGDLVPGRFTTQKRMRPADCKSGQFACHKLGHPQKEIRGNQGDTRYSIWATSVFVTDALALPQPR